ncbi:MAG: hypothetical protein SLRJCFUN_001912 [Candidatus Fervidibacter sp.]
MTMQRMALVLSLLIVKATVAPAMSLSKGAFVGAFTVDGQSIPLAVPTKGQWVSAEQVRRELLFQRWQPPLTTQQMATLARNLEADFSVDVLAAAVRERKGFRAVVALRVVSAPLNAVVHLRQATFPLPSPDALADLVARTVTSWLNELPTEVPTALVQLRDGERRLLLQANGGEWRKGMTVLIARQTRDQWQPQGTARLVDARRLADGRRWLLEAELLQPANLVRPGDRAFPTFSLPPPFERWR